MAVWYNTNDKWEKVSFAGSIRGSDAYLCCPGPSLNRVKNERLHVPGAYICAINTAYPHITPHTWIGMDKAECYDRGLWFQMFRKICRKDFSEMRINGFAIKDAPETYFADIKTAANPHELFRRLGPEVKFVWHRNTMAVALHYLVWIGASRIHFLGCDFGGDNDYHDRRKLKSDLRAINLDGYKKQVKYLEAFSSIATTRGIELISCTPGSPINRFLPFKPLEQALNETQQKLPKMSGTPVHSHDVSDYHWLHNDPHGRGILVSIAPGQEDLIPWWWENYAKTNDYPVRFIDFGLNQQGISFCKEHGEVIDITDCLQPGWMKKPFALLRTPFKETLMMDADVEVRRSLEPYFDRITSESVTIGWDSWQNTVAVESEANKYFRKSVPDTVLMPDSGLIGVSHGNRAVRKWCDSIAGEPVGHFNSDSAALAMVLHREGTPVNEIPKTLHRLRLDTQCENIPDHRLITFHWTGAKGKQHLYDLIYKSKEKI